MLKRVLFFVLMAFCSASWAQTTLTGGVYDYSNKTFPLDKVAVQNITNKSFTTTDERGRFTISAKLGDLIAFAQFGYHPDTILVINLSTRTVFMTPKPVDINGVDVNGVKLSPYIPTKDPEAREYKRLSTNDLHNKENNDRAGGINLSLGFGKYKREKAKLQEIAEKEFYEQEVNENFTDKRIFDLVKLIGTDLKNFKEMFRPTVDQVRIQRPFKYDFYIVTAYNQWLKLPPEQRKLPALPKLKANP